MSMRVGNPGQNEKRGANDAVPSGYQVVRGDLAVSCEDVTRVWGNTVGWPGHQADGYRAYYLDGEVDSPDLILLRHMPSGRIVGTLGVSPRKVRWDNQDVRAGMLSHLCVEPEHRRIRQGKLLMAGVVDACAGRYDVLYAMPRTPESMAFARLMVKAMDGRLVCEQTRRVRVLRYASYVGRFLPRPLATVVGGLLDVASGMRSVWRRHNDIRCNAEWTTKFDPRMAALWQQSAKDKGWMATRDEQTLRWRFDRVLSRQRRYLLLSTRASEQLSAWFACDINPYDPDILVVQDFWHGRGADAIAPSAVRTLCREARSLGFAAVEMRLAAPESVFMPWTRESFVERNRAPIYMRWLCPVTDGENDRPYHITDLDNDG